MPLIIHLPKNPARSTLRLPKYVQVANTITQKSTISWSFVPKEAPSLRCYDICVHAGEIHARVRAGATVCATGNIHIFVGPEYGHVFRGELYPRSAEAFEVLSQMRDDLITLLLRFRELYPNESLELSATFRPNIRTPS